MGGLFKGFGKNLARSMRSSREGMRRTKRTQESQPRMSLLLFVLIFLVGVIAIALIADGNVNQTIIAVVVSLGVVAAIKLLRPKKPSGPKAQELYELLAAVPMMSGTQFEFFTARVLRGMGYDATVLGGSGRGRDLAGDGRQDRCPVQELSQSRRQQTGARGLCRSETSPLPARLGCGSVWLHQRRARIS